MSRGFVTASKLAAQPRVCTKGKSKAEGLTHPFEPIGGAVFSTPLDESQVVRKLAADIAIDKGY